MPTYRAEGSRSPRPSGKSRLGRPDPRHRKVISEFLPCAQLCAGRPRVGKGLKAALPPGKLTASASRLARPPVELDLGAQVAALGARRGTWLCACLPPAPGHSGRRPARDSGRKLRGAGSRATSAARRCPPLARPTAYRSPPRFRPLGRRLSSLGPGSGTPSRPPSLQGARAPGALGAEPSARQPRHGCGWAPRHRMRRCSLGRRYCEPGWRERVGVGERGGRRDAAGAEAR